MRAHPDVVLTQGAAALGLDIAAAQQSRLLDYVGELHHWGRAYNLTGTEGLEALVERHLLDSLAVLPWVPRTPLLDVGSGAGLPGLVLAIARPDWSVTLLDSNRKKLRFLRYVVRRLGLANVKVVDSRAEGFQPERRFPAVIARAFAPLPRLIATAGHLCAEDGLILAMKGPDPAAEIAAMEPGWTLDGVWRLDVPGASAPRHLVVVSRDDGGARGAGSP